ncbi:hypothetical protein POTOM_052198 [Populus tomentosa]|uniref:Uncharacterized protein n=1 Tax=Populus tomentosa TaxID=118781 RepID=A0A8X7Y5V9_POPTO|nr:hypothetical protein POTOM_052198 [Populus tomentosa]
MKTTQFLSVQTETYKLGFYRRGGKMEQSNAKGGVQTKVSPPPLRISNPVRHFTYLYLSMSKFSLLEIRRVPLRALCSYQQGHFCKSTKKGASLEIGISFSLFPKPLILYINTGVFSFLSHYLERKYMFLICNGILAILAKSSVSSSKTPASDDQSNLGDERQFSSAPTLSSAKAEATVDDQEVQVASVESLEDIVLATEEEEEEEATSSQALITEEEEYMEEKRECLVKQEEEEGNEELASTEELNKRIEEFIRKMKEEIRIEAQQQLIAV